MDSHPPENENPTPKPSTKKQKISPSSTSNTTINESLINHPPESLRLKIEPASQFKKSLEVLCDIGEIGLIDVNDNAFQIMVFNSASKVSCFLSLSGKIFHCSSKNLKGKTVNVRNLLQKMLNINVADDTSLIIYYLDGSSQLVIDFGKTVIQEELDDMEEEFKNNLLHLIPNYWDYNGVTLKIPIDSDALICVKQLQSLLFEEVIQSIQSHPQPEIGLEFTQRKLIISVAGVKWIVEEVDMPEEEIYITTSKWLDMHSLNKAVVLGSTLKVGIILQRLIHGGDAIMLEFNIDENQGTIVYLNRNVVTKFNDNIVLNFV